MHEKPAIGGPLSYLKRKFSEIQTGWLTWEDSNSHMALWKIAFDMSHEFRRTSANIGSETFAPNRRRITGQHLR